MAAQSNSWRSGGAGREETARVIVELTGVPLPDASARAALAVAPPQGGRTQDDDDDPNNK